MIRRDFLIDYGSGEDRSAVTLATIDGKGNITAVDGVWKEEHEDTYTAPQ